MRFYTVGLISLWITACVSAPYTKRQPAGNPDDIHIVATTDVHGYLLEQKAADGSSFGGIDTFSGMLQIARQVDPETLLVDSGDLYEGTILSNTSEGSAVVTWMNYAGYNATAIGNHDFDFGPGGGHSQVLHAGEDPLGVLKARIKQAQFSFLSANICSIDEDPGQCADIKTFKPASFTRPWEMKIVHGVKVALLGLTTPNTPNSTLPTNVARLRFMPLGESLARFVAEAKANGADTVIVIAHEGTMCPNQQCNLKDPLFKMVDDLSSDLRKMVGVVLAGHTHNLVNVVNNGVRFMIDGSYNHVFGYITLVRDKDGYFTAIAGDSVPINASKPFLGETVTPDAAAIQKLGDAVTKAEGKSNEVVGKLASPLSYVINGGESSLGDFVSDAIRLCLQASCAPSAALDIAFMNGTGLRIKNIAKGDVTYGQIFTLLPFDNAIATVTMTGRQVHDLVVSWFNYNHGNMNDLSGLHIDFTPTQTQPREMKNSVGETETLQDPIRTIELADGTPLDESKTYRVGMADFLAQGGSGSAFVMKGIKPAPVFHQDRQVREAVLDYLHAHLQSPLDYSVVGGNRLHSR